MSVLTASLRAAIPSTCVECANRLLEAGFEGLVLEDPLTEHAWDALRSWLPRESVAAIRLFAPTPKSVPVDAPPPFRLGSLRRADREDALQQAERTLEIADAFAIPRILLPVARLDGPRDDAIAAAVFDVYRSTVYQLLERASRYPVTICLTPTSRDDELPGREALETCRREFAGARAGIWLDVARFGADPEVSGATDREAPPDEAGEAEDVKDGGDVAGFPLEGVSVRSPRNPDPGVGPAAEARDEKRLRAILLPAPVRNLDPGKNPSGADLQAAREWLDGLTGDPKGPEGPFSIF